MHTCISLATLKPFPASFSFLVFGTFFVATVADVRMGEWMAPPGCGMANGKIECTRGCGTANNKWIAPPECGMANGDMECTLWVCMAIDKMDYTPWVWHGR